RSRSRKEGTRVNASPEVAETFLMETLRTIFGRRSQRWGGLPIMKAGRGAKSHLGPRYFSKNQERFPVRTSEFALSVPSFGYRRWVLFTENLQPPPTGGMIARVLPSLKGVENPSLWETDLSFRRNWRYSRGFPVSSIRYSFSASPCFAVKRSRRFRTFVPPGTSIVSSRRLTNSRTEAKYWIFTFKGSHVIESWFGSYLPSNMFFFHVNCIDFGLLALASSILVTLVAWGLVAGWSEFE